MENSKIMKKEEDKEELEYIEIDRSKAKTDILSKGIFEDSGVKIKLWEGDEESGNYIGEIKKDNFQYIGVLNSKLRRYNYGVNYNANGDIYFGIHENDKRNSHGAYFFKPTIKEGLINSEAYYGFWKNNKKDRHGVYIWKREKEGNRNFAEADYDAYIGLIENDNYKRGTYLSKVGNNTYVYYGDFDTEGRKNDDRSFFYSAVQDRVYIGKIENDRFIEGYLIYFAEDGNISTVCYIEIDENNKPENIVKSEEIEEETKNSIVDYAVTFRNCVLDQDWFEMTYNKFQNVTDLIENDMKDFSVLDDEKKYPQIMKIGAGYNDIKINAELRKGLD